VAYLLYLLLSKKNENGYFIIIDKLNNDIIEIILSFIDYDYYRCREKGTDTSDGYK
jgi:hypothetical protein